PARPLPGRAIFRQLVQRVRPVAPVDEIEIRVAGMVRDGAPVPRVLHSMNDGAVAAGRFAETAAMLAARQRAELAIDERNDLPREIVRVVPDRRRIDVLVTAERGEAVRKDDDRRSHLSLVYEPRGALRHVVAEGLPVGVREARSGEPDEI